MGKEGNTITTILQITPTLPGQLEYHTDYITLHWYCSTEEAVDREATEEMQPFIWSSLMCKILSYNFSSQLFFLFIFKILTGLAKAKHSQQMSPVSKRKDIEMRELVKKEQKGAATNSKFLQVELNFLKDAQHQHMPLTTLLSNGKRKWAQVISPQSRDKIICAHFLLLVLETLVNGIHLLATRKWSKSTWKTERIVSQDLKESTAEEQ